MKDVTIVTLGVHTARSKGMWKGHFIINSTAEKQLSSYEPVGHTADYMMCSNHLQGSAFQHIRYSVTMPTKVIMTASDSLCCFWVNNFHYLRSLLLSIYIYIYMELMHLNCRRMNCQCSFIVIFSQFTDILWRRFMARL